MDRACDGCGEQGYSLTPTNEGYYCGLCMETYLADLDHLDDRDSWFDEWDRDEHGAK